MTSKESVSSNWQPEWEEVGTGWWHRPWDEEIQAEFVHDFYTIAFSKEQMEAITWWNINDNNSFNVSGGLLDKNNRPKQFKVVTTILAQSIDGKQIGDLFERRWEGEVDIRTIKCTMQMDILRCKTPEMVHKEIWTHLLAYNLLRTVIAVAANEEDIEPRKVSFKGAKQALTAFAPKIEAARPEDRAALIDAMITTIAYHRVGNRPGRWEPRARKRRPKKATRLMQPRNVAKLPENRERWF